MAAESQFRSQWTSWSRRDADVPVSTSSSTNPLLSKISSLNPFGNNGYIRLPTTNPEAQLPARSREEEEAGWFASMLSPYYLEPLSDVGERISFANLLVHGIVSRWDRLLGFAICNLGAAACFVICFFMFPLLSMRPRKFAVLYV